jgi:pimeloyl-ACP methyl ester carboxylesterase
VWSEGHVEVDGVRIRYRQAGQGPALVHLLDANGAAPAEAHELLARRFRVIVLETPAIALDRLIESLGLEAADLLASGEAGASALRLAARAPERVRALVLESPTALVREADLERQLSDVTAPTLVVFGTSDGADAQDTGRVYAGSIPNGHLVFVYDAGRAVGRDRPEAFVEVVADFLERHEAFVISRTPTVIHP